MDSKTKLLDWLRDHPLIKVSDLEREAGVPERSIRRALLDINPLPEKHVPPIVNVLKEYGFKY